MRRYETITIVDPDLSDEQRESLFGRIKETISQKKGELLVFDDWGVRTLAYEVKKRSRGRYVRLDYCGEGDAVTEIERLCRIDDRVMKYMTVQLENAANIEKIKAQLAGQDKQEEKTETSAEAVSAKSNDDISDNKDNSNEQDDDMEDVDDEDESNSKGEDD